MKRIVFIVVLAALLVSTVSATAGMVVSQKTALTCEPPAFAPSIGNDFGMTGTLTGGTSGKPVAHRVIFLYTSADGKKWTVAGFNNTDENGQYIVTTKRSNPGTYSYKAVFEGDTAFKKATSQVVPVKITAAGSYNTKITAFDLYNLGWFVARMGCYYSTDGGVTWNESGYVQGITNGHGGFAELDTLGVPVGSLVKMHADVVGGRDRTGSEVFEYVHYNGYDTGYYAEYYIEGATWNPSLRYGGLTRW